MAGTLLELLALKDGWAGAGSKAPVHRPLLKMWHWLFDWRPADLPAPRVVPTQDGNLLLEWPGVEMLSVDCDLMAQTAWLHAVVGGRDVERLFDADSEREAERLWSCVGELLDRNE